MVIVPSNFKKKVIKQLKSNCSVGFHEIGGIKGMIEPKNAQADRHS